MSVLTSTWRQLVQRRLWPIALVLVGALVAVPLTLAKPPAPAVAPAPAAPRPAADASGPGGAALVALADDAAPRERRRVLGARKNPFAGQPLPRPRRTRQRTRRPGAASTTTATRPAGAAGTKEVGSGATGGLPASPAPSAPAPAPTTKAPAPTYPRDSLTVRFGDADASGSPPDATLRRLDPLPDADAPLLVYLGLSQDGRSAIFLVDASASVEGDGRCDPTPTSCETLALRAGETEFLDVKNADDPNAAAQHFELDVVAIHRGRTRSRAASRRVSVAGRKAVAARIGAHGPLRWTYDPATGRLRPRSPAVRAKIALTGHR
jgi:hypothetical protein